MTTTQWFVHGDLGDPEARLLRKQDGHQEAWNPVQGRWVATLLLLRDPPREGGPAIRPISERTAMAHFPAAFHPTYYALGDTLLVRGPDGPYLWTGRHWLRDLMVDVNGLPPVDVEVARQRWPDAFLRERSQTA